MYSLQFSKNFPLLKNGGHFEFSKFCPKMAKHNFAYISLTVRDRAILLTFSTHRVSKECTLCNFQKIFPSSKMAAILNFRIFAKNGKTQICHFEFSNFCEKQEFASIFLTMQDRVISSKFSTQPMQKGMKLK